ncbi:HPr family phosphocarrier protein [Chlorobium sp. BLA1]|uniref:HPr family phosphocarrier protein n=1 Tax=Candidatus Chlorobium masyuteum TaxID=2716876 RepID=UPI00142121C1|nr:HPr family phosphocarrier protein [Candidatus Chlorobium masyuteum]NHQ60201.1 HPr family phosphocarrier protein [Candidatus Chlorobium masyuteum]NTU44536.1 HPr family phosphocarrier protein [Chlorobiaceae bacterium]
MVNKHLTVKTPHGLHFRAAAKIVRISREQQCSILLEKKNGETASAESLLEMLTLCAISGTKLKVTAEGRNGSRALAMIEEVFENGAGI